MTMYSEFYKRYGFAFQQLLLCRPTMRVIKEFKQTELLSKKDIKERQLRSLDEVYRLARTSIPFYQEKYANCGESIKSFEQFLELPILDRTEVATNYRNVIVGGEQNKNIIISRTGGSSGEPLAFYTFKGSSVLGLAMMSRARAWWGIDFSEKSVLFIEHGLKFEDDLGAYIKRSLHCVKEKFLNRQFLSAYKMSDEDMERYYREIITFSPAYFIGYASFLYLFAKHLKDYGRRGNDIGLRCIFYTSEMLYPWQQKIIEEVFECPVVGEYGLKEVGVVSYECPRKRFHTMDESVYVEVIPLRDNPKIGEVVVTQLLNRESPLIRYRTGDIAEVVDRDESCPCGRGLHVMGKIQGRSHDWIATPLGKKIHGQIFTHALIVRDCVKKFQVHQDRDYNISVKVVPNERFKYGDGENIIRNIKGVLGEAVNVNVEVVDHIKSGSSGKFRWIKSEISVYDRSVEI